MYGQNCISKSKMELGCLGANTGRVCSEVGQLRLVSKMRRRDSDCNEQGWSRHNHDIDEVEELAFGTLPSSIFLAFPLTSTILDT